MTHLKRTFISFILACAFSFFTACEKKEAIIEAISESEAVEIITANLETYSGGLSTNLELITEQLVEAVKSGEICDSLYVENLSKEHDGVQLEASYTTDLSYQLTCNGFGVPQLATFTSSGEVVYESTKIKSDDSIDFSGTTSGLSPMESSMVVAGSFEKEGIQELRFKEQKDVKSKLIMDLKSIQLDKQDFHIESGTGIFSLEGSNGNVDFFYSGEIFFLGNQSASLTIDGVAYDVSWN